MFIFQINKEKIHTNKLKKIIYNKTIENKNVL